MGMTMKTRMNAAALTVATGRGDIQPNRKTAGERSMAAFN